MKKRIIVTAVTAAITACLALCAAVWPHNNATEQTHPSQPRKPL